MWPFDGKPELAEAPPPYKLLAALFPAAWPADLSNLFVGLVGVLIVLSVLRRLRGGGEAAADKTTRSSAKREKAFAAFQRESLAVFLVTMLADWRGAGVATSRRRRGALAAVASPDVQPPPGLGCSLSCGCL